MTHITIYLKNEHDHYDYPKLLQFLADKSRISICRILIWSHWQQIVWIMPRKIDDIPYARG